MSIDFEKKCLVRKNRVDIIEKAWYNVNVKKIAAMRGDTAMAKTTKITLKPGDRVTFTCEQQAGGTLQLIGIEIIEADEKPMENVAESRAAFVAAMENAMKTNS